jgi:hypothetical protein
VEPVENAVHVAEVFPDESADVGVVGDHLVACWRALDAAVIHKGPGDIGDLIFKDEGDIFMEYRSGVGPTLWQAG